MSAHDASAPSGARELRKQRTRRALLDAAEELFAQRGYEDVTVAEIAAAAGVSVKTLFQYFRSKEDLLFADQNRMRDEIVTALRDRGRELSPLEALTEWLLQEVAIDDTAEGVERYHRSIGTSQAVASRLRRLWEDYEDGIARELADEANEAVPSPRTRLIAAQLTAMIRVTTSPEVRRFVARHPSNDPRSAMQDWVRQAAELVARGL
jgi:AcrR family transcriptional regulator